MKTTPTLEQFLNTATGYLYESDGYDEEMIDEEEEVSADEPVADEQPVEDEQPMDEEPVDEEPVADEEPMDEEPVDDEDQGTGDITVKDVSAQIKSLTKNLSSTQKKVNGINFTNLTFQKQQEILDALRGVYDSAKTFADEMDSFNALEWK